MMHVHPKGDILRSSAVAPFISELIESWREMPDTLVVLLSQWPDHYDAIIKSMAQVKAAYITFSAHEVDGLKFGLCVLGFEQSTQVATSEFFQSLSQTPFDEGGIYIRGRHLLRLLPNEEQEPFCSRT